MQDQGAFMPPDIGNWGRWGEQDEKGALNFVTPEVIVRAIRLVKRGKAYNLAIPVRRSGIPVAGARNPSLHLMARDGGDFAAGLQGPGNVQSAEDYIFMATHSGTHVDALSHVAYEGKMYNSHSYNTVRSTGARKCDIDSIGSIVTRGLLLDMPSFKKVEYLAKDYVITADDLEACARMQGACFETGDALLIRTGQLTLFEKDPEGFASEQSGLGIAAGEWIGQRSFCAVGADNLAVEKLPWEGLSRGLNSPVHVELLRNRGVFLMELLQLDELAGDHVYEFLFVAAPLRIVGGVGSPLTPLAIA